MLMLNRAFFSLQSPWIPTAIAGGNLALNAALDLAFYRFGTWGIPLATSLVNVAGTVALVVLLRRRIGRLGLADTGRMIARVIAATIVFAAVAVGVWDLLDATLGRSFGAQVVSLGTAFAAGIASYLFFCRLLGVREVEALLSLRARLRRS